MEPSNGPTTPWQFEGTTTFQFDAPSATRVQRAWDRAPKTSFAPQHKGRKVWKRPDWKDAIERQAHGQVESTQPAEHGAKRQRLKQIPALPAQFLRRQHQYAPILQMETESTPKRKATKRRQSLRVSNIRPKTNQTGSDMPDGSSPLSPSAERGSQTLRSPETRSLDKQSSETRPSETQCPEIRSPNMDFMGPQSQKLRSHRLSLHSKDNEPVPLANVDSCLSCDTVQEDLGTPMDEPPRKVTEANEIAVIGGNDDPSKSHPGAFDQSNPGSDLVDSAVEVNLTEPLPRVDNDIQSEPESEPMASDVQAPAFQKISSEDIHTEVDHDSILKDDMLREQARISDSPLTTQTNEDAGTLVSGDRSANDIAGVGLPIDYDCNEESRIKIGEPTPSQSPVKFPAQRAVEIDHEDREPDEVQSRQNEGEDKDPVKRTRSGARFSDDASILKDFLNRAQARKAALALQGETQSPIRMSPRRSPRKILGSLDSNSPSSGSPQRRVRRPGTPPGKTPVALSDKVEDDQKDNEPTSARRSGRVRLSAPSKAPSSVFNVIAVRRPDGSEPVVLQRSQAQEIATVTRSNTRRNKGPAKMPKVVLGSLSKAESPQKSVAKKQKEGKGKKVDWDEKLVYYLDEKEAKDGEESRGLRKKGPKTPGAGKRTAKLDLSGLTNMQESTLIPTKRNRVRG